LQGQEGKEAKNWAERMQLQVKKHRKRSVILKNRAVKMQDKKTKK
jgi:hypothetical protein